MSAKSERRRSQARAKRATALALNQKQIDQQSEIHAGREILLESEGKILLAEMRDAGFAPPKGLPTQKQFARYAAYRKAQAMVRAASIAEDELAIAQAEGGLLSRIYTRLNKPGIKDTAFATYLNGKGTDPLTVKVGRADNPDGGYTWDSQDIPSLATQRRQTWRAEGEVHGYRLEIAGRGAIPVGISFTTVSTGSAY